MTEPRVMDALREKRSELSGIVSHLEQRIVQHRASLVHLDAAMRLFDPDLVLEEAGPLAINLFLFSGLPRPSHSRPPVRCWAVR